MAKMGMTAPFMVMETDILSSGISSKRVFMSSTESMATPEFEKNNTSDLKTWGFLSSEVGGHLLETIL